MTVSVNQQGHKVKCDGDLCDSFLPEPPVLPRENALCTQGFCFQQGVEGLVTVSGALFSKACMCKWKLVTPQSLNGKSCNSQVLLIIPKAIKRLGPCRVFLSRTCIYLSSLLNKQNNDQNLRMKKAVLACMLSTTFPKWPLSSRKNFNDGKAQALEGRGGLSCRYTRSCLERHEAL